MLPLPKLHTLRHTSFFFFNDTATTEIYTLSLHDALPIYRSLQSPPPPTGTAGSPLANHAQCQPWDWNAGRRAAPAFSSSRDRKSTRLNSSHTVISYAVFCLKKKKNIYQYSHTYSLITTIS